MLRVSRLTDYATVVLAQMARAPERVHRASDLAESTHVGHATVSKLLKQLARAGLLISYRGAHGGYALARPADAISAADIIDTMEGPVAMTECSLEGRHCELEAVCTVGHHWQRINQAIRTALEQVTLADLATPSAAPLRRMDLEGAIASEARVGDAQVNG